MHNIAFDNQNPSLFAVVDANKNNSDEVMSFKINCSMNSPVEPISTGTNATFKPIECSSGEESVGIVNAIQ
jgi:hypothetical protein